MWIEGDHRPVAEDNHSKRGIEVVLRIEVFEVIHPDLSELLRRHLAPIDLGGFSDELLDRLPRQSRF